MAETILSTIPFRGLLVSIGLVLPGIVVFALVYHRFRERRHLGVLAVASVALLQFIFQLGLVWAGGYRGNIGLGMQFHRLAALFSAGEIAALPYFLGVSLDHVPRLARFNRKLAWVGLAIVTILVVAAFAAPNIFVSITEPETEIAAIDAIDLGRGETGLLYTIRNGLLLLLTVYAAVVAIIDLARSTNRQYTAPIAIGLVIAVLLGLDDLYRLLTGFYSGVFTTMSYSRFGIGLSIFVVLAMSAMAYRFVNDARRIRSVRIQLVRNEAAIERFAYTDALTALGNTARLEHDLTLLLKESRGGRNRSVALCIFDIERFRTINALYGTRFGDQCLETVAGRLRENVTDEKKLYRMTGNRFAFVALDTGSEQVEQHISGLVKVLTEPIEIEGYTMQLSVRAGIALAPDHAHHPLQLIARCEAAVDVSESILNPVVVYNDELRIATDRYGEIVRALHQATDEDQFHLVYQPIVRNDGSIAASEALLRWQHPQLGRVSPAEFIPIAEDVGLIIPITDLVSRKLLHTLINLRDNGIETQFTMNLSVKQLRQSNVCVPFCDQLAKNDLAPSTIIIEVTESAVMRDMAFAAGSLQSISKLGFQIAIDDFGTGYSSFGYLRELPVQEIKIDRTFLNGYPENPRQRAMVSSIVELARSLDLIVVAEGVENADQRAALIEENCDLFQGFHFHRPMPLNELSELLATKGATG